MKTTLLTFSFLMLTTSCLPKMDKTGLKFDGKDLNIQENTARDAVQFETLKTEILEQKCLGCHKSWSSEALFQDDKMIIGDPDNSKMYQIVRSGRMPVGKKLPDGTREKIPPLDSAEINKIYDYIKNAKAIYEPVTFEELKTKVLEPKCIACHKKWTTEEEFIRRNITPGNAATSKLYDSVMAPRMPKSPLNEDGTTDPVVPLSKKETKLIRNYINNLKPKAAL